jgi:hypothetical protein
MTGILLMPNAAARVLTTIRTPGVEAAGGDRLANVLIGELFHGTLFPNRREPRRRRIRCDWHVQARLCHVWWAMQDIVVARTSHPLFSCSPRQWDAATEERQHTRRERYLSLWAGRVTASLGVSGAVLWRCGKHSRCRLGQHRPKFYIICCLLNTTQYSVLSSRTREVFILTQDRGFGKACRPVRVLVLDCASPRQLRRAAPALLSPVMGRGGREDGDPP